MDKVGSYTTHVAGSQAYDRVRESDIYSVGSYIRWPLGLVIHVLAVDLPVPVASTYY